MHPTHGIPSALVKWTHVATRKDYRVHVSGSSGGLFAGKQMVEQLAHHPDPSHVASDGGGRPVLLEPQARLVTDEVALPAEANPCALHACEVRTEQGEALAHVVWFKPAVGDIVAGWPASTTSNLVTELQKWAEKVQSDAAAVAVQPQGSGIYVSLGNGVLPGKGRTSHQLSGVQCNMPFSRSPPSRSDEVEPLLSLLNTTVGECLLMAFPHMEGWLVASTPTHATSQAGEQDSLMHHVWEGMCQYPFVPEGRVGIPSHQVVVRGNMRSDTASSSGADLHRDKMDGCGGGAMFGGCITFLGVNERRQGQWHDFAVLTEKHGGSGVRVRVRQGEWVCALVSRYNIHLHGSVFNPPEEDLFERIRGVDRAEGMFVVSYTLRMIETFVKCISSEAPEVQRRVMGGLDERLRRLLRDRLHVNCS